MTDRQFLELVRMLEAVRQTVRAAATDDPMNFFVDMDGHVMAHSAYDPLSPGKFDMADSAALAVVGFAEMRNRGSSR